MKSDLADRLFQFAVRNILFLKNELWLNFQE